MLETRLTTEKLELELLEYQIAISLAIHVLIQVRKKFKVFENYVAIDKCSDCSRDLTIEKSNDATKKKQVRKT